MNDIENITDTTDIQRLRVALLGNDIHLLNEVNLQLRDPEIFSNRLADGLSDAIVTVDAKSNKFSYSLRDPLLKSLSLAAQTKPDELSKSLAPIIGKAVVSAVADAMKGVNQQIEALIVKSFTAKGLKWRFESWRTGEPYSRIAMRSTHDFQVLRVAFLSKRQGKLLTNVQAKGVLDQRGIEEQNQLLESLAMKMQINANADEIKPVDVNDTQIYVAHSTWVALAVVTWGVEPENLTRKMMQLLSQLGQDYALDLKKFKTDASPFESAKPLLLELMQGYEAQTNEKSIDDSKKSSSKKSWFYF